jgi:hypothetical protein
MVAYYHKKEGQYPERIYIMYGYWPLRNLKRFGNLNWLYQRPSTLIEDEWMKTHYRLYAGQYENWNDIWDDTLNSCKPDSPIFDKIIDWSKKYKLDSKPLELITKEQLEQMATASIAKKLKKSTKKSEQGVQGNLLPDLLDYKNII